MPELLRLLDPFLPRINFGKPVLQPGQESSTTDATGFSYLKRDLVRLLGILCHKDEDTQNCIRKCDGIPLIMSMCVIDERNPCECHAFESALSHPDSLGKICANTQFSPFTTYLTRTAKTKL